MDHWITIFFSPLGVDPDKTLAGADLTSFEDKFHIPSCVYVITDGGEALR